MITCPKCQHVRNPNDDPNVPEYQCPECGVIYKKYLAKLSESFADIPESIKKKKSGAVQNKAISDPTNSKEKLIPESSKQSIKPYTSSQRINQQIADLGAFDSFFTKKEISYLPEIIRNDEIIKGLTSGLLDGNTWLIIVSNQRLLFLDKGMLYGLKQMEIDFGQISSVTHSTGLLLGSITVSTSGGLKTIKDIQKVYTPKISQLISDLIKQSKQPSQPIVLNESIDIVSQLEKLAALLEKGILSQDEFQVQKEKLLNQ